MSGMEIISSRQGVQVSRRRGGECGERAFCSDQGAQDCRGRGVVNGICTGRVRMLVDGNGVGGHTMRGGLLLRDSLTGCVVPEG